jgi:hypothetical protein
MKEEVCQDENRSERTAADEARGRSERHQAEAARFEVVRDKLVPQAATDYFAARDDARTIEAGPGRAASHAKRPRSTKPRPTAARSPSAGTRPGFRLPGSTWSDDHVRRRAGEVAKRIVDSGVRNNTKRAEEQVKTAAALEHRIALRDYRQESARVTNGHRPGQRQALIEDTEQRRAINAEARKTRVRHTEAMSPNDVVGADRARDQLVTKERFRRQSAEWAASISHDRSPSRDSDRSYGMEL